MSLVSPGADQLCCRLGFKDFAGVFFPDLLHAQFDLLSIEKLVNEHTKGFRSTTIAVEVSTGAAFSFLKLVVNVFRPKTDDHELLRQARLTVGNDNKQNSEFGVHGSLPIGLVGVSQSDMKKACSKYIDKMVAAPGFAEQVTAGDRSPFALQLLKVMQKYATTVSPTPFDHCRMVSDRAPNRSQLCTKRSNSMQCTTL